MFQKVVKEGQAGEDEPLRLDLVPECVWCNDSIQPPLSGDVFHIWMQELTTLHFNPFWFGCLDSKEQSDAMEYATRELHERYVAAHFFVRKVLGTYLSCAPENVELCREECGKPMIKGRPCEFSVTHTDKRVLVAVSANKVVGIDAEETGYIPEWELIANRWFSKEEVEWISEQGDTSEAFMRCWVCREAVLKAHGAGLSLPLESLRMPPPSSNMTVMCSQEQFKVNELTVQCPSALAQWVGALAYCL